MTQTPWVYLNGAFVPADEALISPFDRGFLFAHAAYEVTAVFDSKLIDFDAHLRRLETTLKGLEIAQPELDLRALHSELIARNTLQEGLIYLQVSAGDQGWRDFNGPEHVTPSVFAFVTPRTLIGEVAENGITAITVPDTRWTRRNLKTTQLVSQCLAYRQARRADSQTAILHEDGVITEAASANLWIVSAEGRLLTRDLSAALLPGITRARVLDLLRVEQYEVEERAFTLAELSSAREVFTTSTGVVIAPILTIDSKPVGAGIPGPVVRLVQRHYYTHIGADIDQYAWVQSD